MHLREVTLRNWRSYRTATFRLPRPAGKKNVVLIGAMNGTGKTSFLVALYLGLFGREAMHLIQGVKLGGNEDERVKSYRQLLSLILHRPALDTEDPHAMVQLEFELNGKPVQINRSWHYTRGGTVRDLNGEGEECRIVDNGRVVRLAGWQEANNYIAKRLFPSHIMPCYFFDGEQAQQRVDASGAVSEAAKILFGTGLLDELDESLKHYVQNEGYQAKKSLGEVDLDELSRKRRRRDEIEEERGELAKKSNQIRTELEGYESARTQAMFDLSQLPGDAIVDLRMLAEKKANLMREEERFEQELYDSIASLALPIAAKRHVGPLVSTLTAEMVRDRWLLVRDETSAKADLIAKRAVPAAGDTALNPPLTREQHDQLAARLRQALDTLWSPPPSGCAAEYTFKFLTASDRPGLRDRIGSIAHGDVANAGEIAGKFEYAKSQRREVQRKLDSYTDLQPRIEELKKKIEDLNAKITTATSLRTSLELKDRGLQAEYNDLLAKIGLLENVKRKLGPVEQRLEVAERVKSVVRDLRKEIVPLCRGQLERRCTEHLREMISDEYRNFSVKFDDDLRAVLVHRNSPPVYVTTLSGAQKRAFGLAFTLAVADISDSGAPLVIDTPVGNSDSEYRTKMLTHLAKASRGQVIFLSHDEEITGPYEEVLQPYMAANFLVDFQRISDGVGISLVREGQYFGRRQGAGR